MRIVSLVPSWTETLIAAGLNVVGRTRYCVHPSEAVSTIAIVGGTKDAKWDLIEDLKPDLVILDKEENPYEMVEECPVPYYASHVTDLPSLQKELVALGEKLQNPSLIELAIAVLDILELPTPKWNAQAIPGFQRWIGSAESRNSDFLKAGRVNYIIWKNPWMAVSRETYIASVLEKLGGQVLELYPGEKYPVLEEEDLKKAFCLFSSEPFPFEKKIAELESNGYSGALVDGESFSWFGVRSIRFLQAQLR